MICYWTGDSARHFIPRSERRTCVDLTQFPSPSHPAPPWVKPVKNIMQSNPNPSHPEPPKGTSFVSHTTCGEDISLIPHSPYGIIQLSVSVLLSNEEQSFKHIIYAKYANNLFFLRHSKICGKRRACTYIGSIWTLQNGTEGITSPLRF